MVNDSITLDVALEILNQAVALDPDAMAALCNLRVKCNEALSHHETIQVAVIDGIYRIGLVGVLNGLFGFHESGWGAIAADFEDRECAKLLRFVRVPVEGLRTE